MNVKKRITDSFNKQAFMNTIGAELISIESGVVKIACKYDRKITQQHGYIHAGAITTLADTACGYAALTMMEEGMNVLSVEFKTTLMRPAKCEKIIATARVIKAGRRLTFTEAVVTDEKEEIELAKMSATMICVGK